MNSLSLGFRGREYGYKKPDGVFRILVVGDSMVFGSGVFPDSTLTAHMERILNQKHGKHFYHVLNVSRNGYSVMDLLPLYEQTAKNFMPDVVIIVLCNNDAEVVCAQGNYEEHCKSIWKSDSNSWPFFIDNFNGLLELLKGTPTLVTYYGLNIDSISTQAVKMIKCLCDNNQVQFFNLCEKVNWVPNHRAVASNVDGHPSSYVHRIAAIEICKKILHLDFLPKKNVEYFPYDVKPKEGVGPEWKVEEIRAWCSYGRDGVQRQNVIKYINDNWKAYVEDVYSTRQNRILCKWWDMIQYKSYYDSRRYKEHFISISKIISILEKNIENDTSLYLNENGFYDNDFEEIDFDEILNFSKIISDLNFKKNKLPDSVEVWIGNFLWIVNNIINLYFRIDKIEVDSNSSLSIAKKKIKNQWNYVAKLFVDGMYKLCIETFIKGFSNLPLAIEFRPTLDVRISITSPKNGYVDILYKGIGEILHTVSDCYLFENSKTIKSILFKFPLNDLFSCSINTPPNVRIMKIEYRVNLSEWRTILKEECCVNKNGALETPVYPAFL